MEVSGQVHPLAAVPVGKTTWCKLYFRLDEPQNQSLVTPRENIHSTYDVTKCLKENRYMYRRSIYRRVKN
jgi:hypothetical protein